MITITVAGFQKTQNLDCLIYSAQQAACLVLIRLMGMSSCFRAKCCAFCFTSGLRKCCETAHNRPCVPRVFTGSLFLWPFLSPSLFSYFFWVHWFWLCRVARAWKQKHTSTHTCLKLGSDVTSLCRWSHRLIIDSSTLWVQLSPSLPFVPFVCTHCTA